MVTGEELIDSMINAHLLLGAYRGLRNPLSGGNGARNEYLAARDEYLKKLAARTGSLLTATVINPVEIPDKPIAGPIITTNRTIRTVFRLHDSRLHSGPDEATGVLVNSSNYSTSLTLDHPGRSISRPIHSVVNVLNHNSLEPLVTLRFADET